MDNAAEYKLRELYSRWQKERDDIINEGDNPKLAIIFTRPIKHVLIGMFNEHLDDLADIIDPRRKDTAVIS